MKQELPFAIGLLATGALLWFAQSRGADESNAPQTRPQAPRLAARESGALAEPNLAAEQTAASGFAAGGSAMSGRETDSAGRQVELVSYESAAVAPAQQPAIPGAGGPKGSSATPTTPSSYLHPQPSQQAITLLASAAQGLASAEPIGSELKLEASLLSQQVVAIGNYFQLGQGTFKTRLELSFSIAENGHEVPAGTTFQLCDGRFVYSLQNHVANETADEQPREEPLAELEFVDLHRVRAAAGERAGSITPTGWVATGGLAGLLQHLASAFNFGPPETRADGSIVLRGSWNFTAAKSLVGDHVAKLGPTGSANQTQQIAWGDFPPQLPHGIELVLQRYDAVVSRPAANETPSFDAAAAASRATGQGGYFPLSITFVRFRTARKSAFGSNSALEPMARIEFSPPQRLKEITDRFFIIDSTDVTAVDITDQYIRRINSFRVESTSERTAQKPR